MWIFLWPGFWAVSFGRWILRGGEFLEGEFFRGPLVLEKAEWKNATQEFGSNFRVSKVCFPEFGPKFGFRRPTKIPCADVCPWQCVRKEAGPQKTGPDAPFPTRILWNLWVSLGGLYRRVCIVENLLKNPHTGPQRFCRTFGAKPNFSDSANSSPNFQPWDKQKTSKYWAKQESKSYQRDRRSANSGAFW